MSSVATHPNRRRRRRGRPMRRPHCHPRRYSRLARRRNDRRRPHRGCDVWRGHRFKLMAIEASIPPEHPPVSRHRINDAVIYNCDVEIFGQSRRLAIIFPGPSRFASPIVMADGPTKSRHRYRWSRPTSLCMWHPSAGLAHRWNPRTGLHGLIGHAVAHLHEEAVSRATGNRWYSLEHHREPTEDERGRRPIRSTRKPVGTAPTELERRYACWCGSNRRYDKCHGPVSRDTEMRSLGLGVASEMPGDRHSPERVEPRFDTLVGDTHLLIDRSM